MPIRHIHNFGYVRTLGPHELSPAWAAYNVAIDVYGFSPHDRSHDSPGEGTPEIGADAAARLEVLRLQRPFVRGIDNRQVRVRADRDGAFARTQSEQLGGGRGGQVGEPIERHAAPV